MCIVGWEIGLSQRFRRSRLEVAVDSPLVVLISQIMHWWYNFTPIQFSRTFLPVSHKPSLKTFLKPACLLLLCNSAKLWKPVLFVLYITAVINTVAIIYNIGIIRFSKTFFSLYLQFLLISKSNTSSARTDYNSDGNSSDLLKNLVKEWLLSLSAQLRSFLIAWVLVQRIVV